MNTKTLCAWLLLGTLLLPACNSNSSTTVDVMAAASLVDAFTEIEAAFEDANPTYDVRLNLAASSTLREQILEGATADVYASANQATMAAVIDAGHAETPTVFASNTLTVAVPATDNRVTDLADLTTPGLLIGRCALGVPCGDAAIELADSLGLALDVVDGFALERDARSLLTKLEFGELDAGFVYVSDVQTSAEVRALDVPETMQPQVSYPIARLLDGDAPEGGAAFINFVLAPAGQTILQSHGFGAP